MDEKVFKKRTKQETNEIVAMTVASIRTLQKRDGCSPFNRQSKIENLK